MQATIHTPAVSSKEADPAAVPSEIQQRLPSGWRLSEHQLATYAALVNPDIDIVINSAMTGDGKSISGLLSYMSGHNTDGILALYPTNELIRDQERSAQHSLKQWQQGQAHDVTTIYGARLDELVAAAEERKRPGVLMDELKKHPLVLTNPDILHAILQFSYQQYGRDSTNILTTVAENFRQITFDEFHIFDAAQVTAVMIGLLLLYEQRGQPLKTLFLSATPDGLLTNMLHRAGFAPASIKLIEPQREGWYTHGSHPGEGWRDILQESTITFVDQMAEDWVPANVECVILAWFRQHGKGAKAALIVNSVAKALRLTAYLKPRLAAEGLEVKPNTGMTGRTDRQLSYDADLLVGTSTVDVGVDFHINLLIFEANDAGTFLQRLGRLGRHTSYTDRDNHTNTFKKFAAYALVPSFVAERLFTGQHSSQSLLTDGDTVTREMLAQQIREVYPPFAEFNHYARHWGRFQAAKVFDTLLKQKETFAPMIDRLQPRYNQLLNTQPDKAMQQWRAVRKTDEELLIREAQSFRGGSPFDCGVIQKNEAGEDDILTYDLFTLLANFQLEPLDRQTFLKIASRLGVSTRPYDRNPSHQIAYFRRLKQFETFQELAIVLPPAIAQWSVECYQTAQVLPGLGIECRQHPWWDDLDDWLWTYKVVALLVHGCHPLEVRRRLRLPGTFRLHSYRFRDEDQIDGSIAFGREALLLDSRLRHTKFDAPGGGAYFV
jgi:CRISPR-associated endonuclease/helicase Cas3